jgi:hypothetical protein
MSNAYANIERNRVEILLAINGSESITNIERRFDNGRVGRITEWFNKQFGCSPTVFRRRVAEGTTAMVDGSFYFLDASRETRRALADWLDAQQSKAKIRKSLPDGDYQIWAVGSHTCVICTDEYQKTKSVYRKIYKHDLDLEHPLLRGTMSCLHSTDCRGVPLPDSTVAYMFNLIWLGN